MSADSLRVAFAGTPDFAATCLQALISSPHQVVQVLTQPDRPQGRGRKRKPGPVKAVALDAGIEVCQPDRLDADAIAGLADRNADLLIVVAYGLILPRPALDACRLGALNVHASLLPRWRGAAPIQRAIQAGDLVTGITIMQMDEGLDTGPMLAKAETPILDSDTGGSLHDRLMQIGASLLLDTLNRTAQDHALPEGELQNPELATYAHKLSKREAEIDWSQSATVLDRLIRAFHPWPVAYTTLRETRVRILRAKPVTDTSPNNPEPGSRLGEEPHRLLVACGRGVLEIEQLQFAGGKPLSASEALNGHAALLTADLRFSAP